jgi:RecA-family ATPase
MERFTPRPIGELLQGVVPDAGLVEGLIPRVGLTLLSAFPKVGKTYFASHLAACVQGGEDFLGFTVPSAVPVLYLDRESNTTELVARTDILKAEYSSASDVHYLRDAVDLVRDADRLTLCIREGGYGLVVIDTFSTCIVGLDEDDAGSMSKPLDALRRIANGCDTAVLVLAHSQKSAGHLSIAGRTRGSSAISAAANDILHLAEGRKTGEVKLEVKPRIAPGWSTILNRRPNGFWEHRLREAA